MYTIRTNLLKANIVVLTISFFARLMTIDWSHTISNNDLFGSLVNLFLLTLFLAELLWRTQSKREWGYL